MTYEFGNVDIPMTQTSTGSSGLKETTLIISDNITFPEFKLILFLLFSLQDRAHLKDNLYTKKNNIYYLKNDLSKEKIKLIIQNFIQKNTHNNVYDRNFHIKFPNFEVNKNVKKNENIITIIQQILEEIIRKGTNKESVKSILTYFNTISATSKPGENIPINPRTTYEIMKKNKKDIKNLCSFAKNNKFTTLECDFFDKLEECKRAQIALTQQIESLQQKLHVQEPVVSDKYSKMRKAGLPTGAICQAMKKDGIPLADFCNESSSSSSVPVYKRAESVPASVQKGPASFLGAIKQGVPLKKVQIPSQKSIELTGPKKTGLGNLLAGLGAAKKELKPVVKKELPTGPKKGSSEGSIQEALRAKMAGIRKQTAPEDDANDDAPKDDEWDFGRKRTKRTKRTSEKKKKSKRTSKKKKSKRTSKKRTSKKSSS